MGKNDRRSGLERAPFWYKKGVIYQAHVRSFYDADGNGVGDFRGLTEKLGYLKDLGVTAVWLLPFYPSPLKDDGYDIADYRSINPAYGTLADFKEFLQEAHGLGLRVITELVVNHTSDQHRWFQRSRRSKPGSVWREMYVWSSTAEKYKDARIIFKDFETSNWTWDPVANAYYWHRFYYHQPDLNFENPVVHRQILKLLDFWLDMGVDGLRLDAVPYLYEQEGTNCENLPQTHAFLKKMRAHADERHGDRMLLAEANQWPEDAVAYFGSGKGDECHMAFHFPLMPRLFMAVRMEDRIPILDILEQTPAIPETSQWAVFLRNHDELTLEMVTDEERDYMYRVYAEDTKARINLGIRRRLAPLLGNDRKRLELLNALLFSLPGTPVVYYGDEIGMGDNIYLGDRNGVRTPMQWSSDRNAGFSRANPQALYLPVILDPEYHYEAVNVEAQQRNPHSLLWWMKRMMGLRKHWRALGEGSLEFLHPDNRKILAFVRRYEEETILVVANLSRFAQPVGLDLSAFQQMVPFEVVGRTEFPPISDKPYLLTLAPHAFFWFSLEPRFKHLAGAAGSASMLELPAMEVGERWDEVLEGRSREALEERLRTHVLRQRWFGGKAREVKSLRMREVVRAALGGGERSYLLILEIEYVQGDPEFYFMPLAYLAADRAEALQRDWPQLVLTRVRSVDEKVNGIVYDATGNQGFQEFLLESVHRRRLLKGESGQVFSSHTAAWKRARGGGALESTLTRAEQSNTTITFSDKIIFKVLRRLEPGSNPELELGRFLTEREFPHTPALLGSLEYRSAKGETMALAMAHVLVPNSTNAWVYTRDSLGRYYERVRSGLNEPQQKAQGPSALLGFAEEERTAFVSQMVGTYLEAARLLGTRVANLHVALASESEERDFAPEPFTPHYQRSLYQSMRNLAVQNFQLLRKGQTGLPEETAADARAVIAGEGEVIRQFRTLFEHRISAARIRTHGDLHLGQILHTGKDFLIIDFEGEPARPLSERRIKRSPVRDAAGMIRSFHYATYSALYRQVEHGNLNKEEMTRMEPWAQFWYGWVSATFLAAYFEVAGPETFLPKSKEERQILLNAYLLEKAIYELGYELNNRPDWVKIPLRGILQLLGTGEPVGR